METKIRSQKEMIADLEAKIAANMDELKKVRNLYTVGRVLIA